MVWIARLQPDRPSQADTSQTLWDFADDAGVTNPYGVRCHIRGVNWGVVTPDRSLFSPANRDGGTVTRSRKPPVQAGLHLKMEAASSDDLVNGVSALLGYLQEPRVIVWGPENQIRYVDTLGADVVPLLGDTSGLPLNMVIRRFMHPDGYILPILRQPWFRGDQLSSDDNKVQNALLLMDSISPTGTPDFWTWASTTGITNQQINAALDCYSFDIASASTLTFKYEGMAVGTLAAGDVWTFVMDVRGFVTGSGALPSNLRSQVCIRYRNAAGTDIGSDTVSTLANPGNTWDRIFVTATAPTNASSARVDIRFTNTSSASVTVNLKHAQMEEAPSPTAFHSGTETLNNDPNVNSGRRFFFWNPGDLETDVVLQVASDGGTNPERYVLVGVRSSEGIVGKNRLTTLANRGYAIQAEAMGAGTSTSPYTAGASASGSGVNAKVTNFTDNSMTRRETYTISGANQEWVKGAAWRVIARVASSQADSDFTLRPSYHFGDLKNHHPQFDTTVTLTLADLWYEVDIGTIYVPDNVSQLTIELWATRTGGNGNLRADVLFLVPTDGLYQVGADDVSFNDLALETDPEIPQASIVDSSGQVVGIVPVGGGVPLRAKPGLSMVYLHVCGDEKRSSFSNRLVGTVMSPRYN